MKAKIKICLLIALSFCMKGFAQIDSLYLHKGDPLIVNVTKIGEQTITYKFPNEDTENELSKYAIQKIVIGKSGRVQNISDKIVINGEDD